MLEALKTQLAITGNLSPAVQLLHKLLQVELLPLLQLESDIRSVPMLDLMLPRPLRRCASKTNRRPVHIV